MAKDSKSQSTDNSLTGVAKAIGSTLGNAANRASGMLRDVIPTNLSEQFSGGTDARPASAAKPKPKKKTKSAVKKAKSKAKGTISARKSTTKKKAGSRGKKK